MKQSTLLLGLILTLTLSGCVPYYIASNFDAQTADHKTIAVLPFEMIYTGYLPEGLTQEDLDEIGMAESQAFQISFYNEILRSTRSGKNPIRVSLQDHRKTMQILEENDVSIRDSWGENPEVLADMLDVDAVVRGRIEKYRLMSDLASYGIDLGAHILNVLTDHFFWPWLPLGFTKSKEIDSSYSLIDAKNGEVIWSVAFQEEADWSRRANDIIDETNRRGARKFPYRQ